MTLPAYAMGQASFPEMYERWLVGPLFRPFAEDLLARVEPAPGDRVLDVACGTGIVARLAKERLGERSQVVGIDVSGPMLEVARTIAPSVDWREGNAASLPVAAGEKFDVVYCQQGLQFFAAPEDATREMRRVLAAGGRLAVATWLGLEENPIFADLHRVAERRLGAIEDKRYALGDANAVKRLLAVAGFGDVEVARVSRTIRLGDAAVFVNMNTMALVGMSATAASMSEQERGKLVAELADESMPVVARYRDGEGLAFELRTNVATTRG
jgi:SAM-dependent methyltransferase